MKTSNEKKYRALFESLDEGYCVVKVEFDEDNTPAGKRIIEKNSAFDKLSKVEDHEGNPVSLFASKYHDQWFSIYSNVAQTGEAVRFESHLESAGRWYSVYAFPFGEPWKNEVALIFSDITGHKRSEKEFQQLSLESERQKRLYETILSNTPDLVYVFDLELRFIYVNEAMLDLWGMTRNEVLGKPLIEVRSGSGDVDKFKREIERVISSGETVRGEAPVSHDTIGDRIYEYIFVPVLNNQDEVEAVAGTSRDITSHRRLASELEEINESLEQRVQERTRSLISYQQQLRQLASRLNQTEAKERHQLASELHDNLGQMLAIGKMQADSLQKQALTKEMASGLDRLKQILEDALVYTRELMSDLKPPPSLDKEDIRDSMKWLAKKMKKHGLKVSLDDDKRSKVVSEEVRNMVVQCVRELLFNVRKHAGVDEAVVHLTTSDGHVEIVVEDKGNGFSPDTLQGQASQDGGFGLFNIRERIDLMGCYLKINSEPGQGTSVILRVPLKKNGT